MARAQKQGVPNSAESVGDAVVSMKCSSSERVGVGFGGTGLVLSNTANRTRARGLTYWDCPHTLALALTFGVVGIAV